MFFNKRRGVRTISPSEICLMFEAMEKKEKRNENSDISKKTHDSQKEKIKYGN